MLSAPVMSGMPGLPLVVTPENDRSLNGLISLVAREAAAVEEHMKNVGAILFRGFDVQTAEQFQSFGSGLTDKFLDYRRGTSPRKKVAGQVYTSTEAPPRIPIALHCEMAYVNHYPDRILFYCHTPPTYRGETPICDMGKVYDAIDPRVRQRFEERGTRIIQNIPAQKSWKSKRTWMDMFETDDKSHVEQYCVHEEIRWKWKPDGTLQLINERPAVLVHPVTGKKIWFNSAHNFHDSWSWEFRHFGLRGLAFVAALAERFRRRRKNPEDFPIHCQYGDGGEIALEDMNHIRQVLWDHAVVYPWEQGDILLLDNLRVAHARMPFKGERRILVAMGMAKQPVAA